MPFGLLVYPGHPRLPTGGRTGPLVTTPRRAPIGSSPAPGTAHGGPSSREVLRPFGSGPPAPRRRPPSAHQVVWHRPPGRLRPTRPDLSLIQSDAADEEDSVD